jgi:hypothetical protein
MRGDEVPNGSGNVLDGVWRGNNGGRDCGRVLDGEADMTIKRNDGWRKISLDPAPEGQPMRRVELGADLNPVGPKRKWQDKMEAAVRRGATRAPRSIYDEPWMRRILDGVAPPSPKRKRPGDGQGA